MHLQVLSENFKSVSDYTDSGAEFLPDSEQYNSENHAREYHLSCTFINS
jgi:hypothetical protein